MTEHTLVCRGCQSPFTYVKGAGKCGRPPLYCSPSCYPSNKRREAIARECAECGDSFIPAGKRGPLAKFCSRRCSNSAYYSVARVPVEHSSCVQCGQSFSRAERGWQASYCSDECRADSRRKGYPVTKCEACGVELISGSPQPRRFCDDHRPPDSLAAKIRRDRLRGGEDIDNLAVFERDRWTCGICDEPVDPALKFPDPLAASLDHIIPLAAGGKHVYSNVQCAHWICNCRKSTKIAA